MPQDGFLNPRLRVPDSKKQEHLVVLLFFWWAIRDLNPGPIGYEPIALTN